MVFVVSFEHFMTFRRTVTVNWMQAGLEREVLLHRLQ